MGRGGGRSGRSAQHLGQQAGHFAEPHVVQGWQGAGAQQGRHRGVGQFALGGVAAGVGALDPLPLRPVQQLLHQPRLADARLAQQQGKARSAGRPAPGGLQLGPFLLPSDQGRDPGRGLLAAAGRALGLQQLLVGPLGGRTGLYAQFALQRSWRRSW